jgi:Skp family chaperone for outer membrane proteins
MTNRGRVALVILTILILISLSLAGAVFYLLQKEHAQKIALQEELEEVKAKQSITETELKKSRNTISNLEFKLQDADSTIAKLNADLAQEKTAKQSALDEIGQLKIDLEQQKQLRADLEKKFSQAQKETQKLQTQLKELDSKKTELETKLKDLEAKSQRVELGTIVVSNETSVPANVPPKTIAREQVEKVTALEGKVLVINKDYNFVVINLGSKDGVKLGDIFSIYHSNNYVGDVKVEKVHDSMAAAGFVSEGLRDKVSEGDRITQKTR